MTLFKSGSEIVCLITCFDIFFLWSRVKICTMHDDFGFNFKPRLQLHMPHIGDNELLMNQHSLVDCNLVMS